MTFPDIRKSFWHKDWLSIICYYFDVRR